jgi:subfamily B ATP-binding cassette protein MsbA
LFELLEPYWGRLAASMGTGLVASLLDGLAIVLIIPLLKHLFGTAGMLMPSSTRLEHLIDGVLRPVLESTSPTVAAARVVGLLLVTLLLKNGLSLASKQFTTQAEEGLVRDLRDRVYRHLLRLDFNFFQRTKGGELISAVISDADSAKGVVTALLTAGFQNLVLIAVSLYALSLMSVRLTFLTLATAPILVIGIRLLLRRVRRHSRTWAEQRSEITSAASERLGAIRLIRAYGQEEQEGNRWGALTNLYRRQAIRTQRYQVMPTMVTEVFGGLLIVLIIWAAATPALVGQSLGPTVTITFLATALRMMSPIKAAAQAPATFSLAAAGLERVLKILDLEPTDLDRPDEQPARFERELVFDRVGYHYPGEESVLTDVSFTVRKGSVVAIVGPSGAGKTTLLDLVPRFIDPTEGEIRMDGVPLRRLTRTSLRALSGVVSQDTVLLNDTVHTNIAYGRPQASRAEVEAAARAANAAGFIGELPNGYDTVLGERGTRLSGGQRQRIAIARALLKDPPILILDEATSALDSESERLVQEAIERLMANRTVLVVAHRLATVRHADQIIVLDRGRVVERGPHAELVGQNGLYRRLHEMQFQV